MPTSFAPILTKNRVMMYQSTKSATSIKTPMIIRGRLLSMFVFFETNGRLAYVRDLQRRVPGEVWRPPVLARISHRSLCPKLEEAECGCPTTQPNHCS